MLCINFLDATLFGRGCFRKHPFVEIVIVLLGSDCLPSPAALNTSSASVGFCGRRVQIWRIWFDQSNLEGILLGHDCIDEIAALARTA